VAIYIQMTGFHRRKIVTFLLIKAQAN